MGVVYFEGFETVGTATGDSNRSQIQPNVRKRFDLMSTVPFGNEDPNGFLCPDFVGEGFGYVTKSPSQLNASHIIKELPSIISSQPGAGSHQLVIGFRLHVRPGNYNSGHRFSVLGVTHTGVQGTTFMVEFNTNELLNVQLRIGNQFQPVIAMSANGVLLQGAWQYIELVCKITDSGGYVEVYINGEQVINYTGDTNPYTIDTLTQDYHEIYWNLSGGTDATGIEGENFWGLDDIYVLDTDGESAPYNNRLGPMRIKSFPPASDETPLQWAPSHVADHYQLVDENGVNSVDYIETDTDTNTDTFGLNIYTDEPAIFAIKIEAEAINTTSGSPILRLETDGGNTDYTIDNTSSSIIANHYEDRDSQPAEIDVQFISP